MVDVLRKIFGLCVGEHDEDLPRVLDVPAKYAPTLNVRKGNAKYRRGQQYGGGSAMKTAALELTSKKIPTRNMILQGIMKITP